MKFQYDLAHMMICPMSSSLLVVYESQYCSIQMRSGMGSLTYLRVLVTIASHNVQELEILKRIRNTQHNSVLTSSVH
jgi:hypothetical protein